MRIGAHESIAGGLSRAFNRAVDHGAACLQVFTKSARGWASAPLGDDERRAFRAEAKRTGLPAIAHGSYLVNLASADPAQRARSIACTTDELTRCEQLDISYLVIHPGSNPDTKAGLLQVAKSLDQVHRATPRFRARIALEVTAGQGACLGWRFEHLAEILASVERDDRLAVCLDTCHLHAAGYDLSSPASYERVMAEFDLRVGLSRVACIHLNDSMKPLGSRVDRHAEIGRGHLGLEPFRCLVRDPRLERALAVLETPVPERYGESIRLLQSLRS